ncbi:MAG TPA: hydroxymethylbilane synthase [Acidobacteriota bacterium]|jgi:hydroxymethylbilane synthase
MKKIKVGSRGSNLALWQARSVIERLSRFDLECEIEVIKTTGDINRNRFLEIPGKGIFVKEIEEALLRRDIDLAVHSLKDLPTAQPAGLTVGAILERENPRDVLIARRAHSIQDLPAGAKVGTSSLRRITQLRSIRSDIQCQELRGNVETRIRKVQDGHLEAVILAYAGVHRLGMERHISKQLEIDEMIPAPGQGALAVEVHEENTRLREILSQLDHPETRTATSAERLLLQNLGGGCRYPLGAFASWKDDRLVLKAMVARPDGSAPIWGEVSGSSAAEVADKMMLLLVKQRIRT